MFSALDYILETNAVDVSLWFVFERADFISSDVSQDFIFATAWTGPFLFAVELMWCTPWIKLVATSQIVFGKTFAIMAGICYFTIGIFGVANNLTNLGQLLFHCAPPILILIYVSSVLFGYFNRCINYLFLTTCLCSANLMPLIGFCKPAVPESNLKLK